MEITQTGITELTNPQEVSGGDALENELGLLYALSCAAGITGAPVVLGAAVAYGVYVWLF